MSMALVAMSVVTSVIVVNLHSRSPDTHHMHRITRLLLLEWLPWILMMQTKRQKIKKTKTIASAIRRMSYGMVKSF